MPENFHHVIPKSILNLFHETKTDELKKYQVAVTMNEHNLIEACIKPLVWLIQHGVPEDETQHTAFIHKIDSALKTHETRIRKNTIRLVTCGVCDYETPIAIYGRGQKLCRHCGAPIFQGGALTNGAYIKDRKIEKEETG